MGIWSKNREVSPGFFAVDLREHGARLRQVHLKCWCLGEKSPRKCGQSSPWSQWEDDLEIWQIFRPMINGEFPMGLDDFYLLGGFPGHGDHVSEVIVHFWRTLLDPDFFAAMWRIRTAFLQQPFYSYIQNHLPFSPMFRPNINPFAKIHDENTLEHKKPIEKLIFPARNLNFARRILSHTFAAFPMVHRAKDTELLGTESRPLREQWDINIQYIYMYIYAYININMNIYIYIYMDHVWYWYMYMYKESDRYR